MGVSEMKKFLINTAIFFAIVAVVDFSFGKVFHYLQWNVAGGRTGSEYYACKESNEDILIMGSSRAAHHYDSKVIAEGLGKSCFNAGEDGNGIILQYGRWKMISDRYKPKLIIYDISTGYDISINDNMAYIDRLKPFCDALIVKEYVAEIFPMERMKLASQMYRYNYKFLEMIFDCTKRRVIGNGYTSVRGHISQAIIDKEFDKKDTIETDSVKRIYLERLVTEAKEKGTEIVFVISPSWKGGGYTLSAYSSIIDLANKYHIPFYNYMESSICNNPDYFKDSGHLNSLGASEFSKDLVSQIKVNGKGL